MTERAVEKVCKRFGVDINDLPRGCNKRYLIPRVNKAMIARESRSWIKNSVNIANATNQLSLPKKRIWSFPATSVLPQNVLDVMTNLAC